jgi:hypothetical protein
VSKALDLANQEIIRLSGVITKMIPAEKVEEMVNARFQQKMQEEGFVSSTGAIPANMEKAEPTEIKKAEDSNDEITEATNVARQVTGMSWEGVIKLRQQIDPAYSAFPGTRRGLPLKGGM